VKCLCCAVLEHVADMKCHINNHNENNRDVAAEVQTQLNDGSYSGSKYNKQQQHAQQQQQHPFSTVSPATLIAKGLQQQHTQQKHERSKTRYNLLRAATLGLMRQSAPQLIPRPLCEYMLGQMTSLSESAMEEEDQFEQLQAEVSMLLSMFATANVRYVWCGTWR
jgi:hypothetical protein